MPKRIDDCPGRPREERDALSPRRITPWLLLAIALLALASLAGVFASRRLELGGFSRLVAAFNLDREMNVPTWFSSSLLLAAALLLRRLADQDARENRRSWLGLSFVFIFLSLDEVAAIHKLVSEPLRRFFQAGGLLYFSWVIPWALFVLLLFACTARFISSRPQPSRRYFVASAALFLAGALGLEMVGGLYVESQRAQTLAYALLANAEETLELLGLALFIHALLLLRRSLPPEAEGAR